MSNYEILSLLEIEEMNLYEKRAKRGYHLSEDITIDSLKVLMEYWGDDLTMETLKGVIEDATTYAAFIDETIQHINENCSPLTFDVQIDGGEVATLKEEEISGELIDLIQREINSNEADGTIEWVDTKELLAEKIIELATYEGLKLSNYTMEYLKNTEYENLIFKVDTIYNL